MVGAILPNVGLATDEKRFEDSCGDEDRIYHLGETMNWKGFLITISSIEARRTYTFEPGGGPNDYKNEKHKESAGYGNKLLIIKGEMSNTNDKTCAIYINGKLTTDCAIKYECLQQPLRAIYNPWHGVIFDANESYKIALTFEVTEKEIPTKLSLWGDGEKWEKDYSPFYIEEADLGKFKFTMSLEPE
jgi:hypothetical protein